MRKSLTKEMIFNRSKISDLNKVIRLNCWGCDLDDISILRSLPYLEILSLSVNRIKDLSALSHCTKLKELYLRQNDIDDLNQICYLRQLSDLTNLSLSENPCTNSDNYRFTVIRELPHLENLDNKFISSIERSDAFKIGKPIGLNRDMYYSKTNEEIESDCENHNVETECINDKITNKQDSDHEHSENENYNTIYPLTDPVQKMTQLQPVNYYKPPKNQFTQFDLINHNVNHYTNHINNNYEQNDKHFPNCYGSTMINKQIPKCRIDTKNKSMLSAVLCLIKELDYSSLEIIDLEIKCRMDSLKCDSD